MSGLIMWLEILWAPLERPQYLQVSLGLSDNTMFIQHSLKGQTCREVFCLQVSLHCLGVQLQLSTLT